MAGAGRLYARRQACKEFGACAKVRTEAAPEDSPFGAGALTHARTFYAAPPPFGLTMKAVLQQVSPLCAAPRAQPQRQMGHAV